MLPLFLLVSTECTAETAVCVILGARPPCWLSSCVIVLSTLRYEPLLPRVWQDCPRFQLLPKTTLALFMRNNGILSWFKKKITFYSITFLWIIYKSLAHVHVTKITRLKELATAANNCHCQHNDCDFRFSVTVSSCLYFSVGKFVVHSAIICWQQLTFRGQRLQNN
jgi:hypothetical protein